MVTFAKFYNLHIFSERTSALVLLGLMLIGMILETLGVGLVVPTIALLMQDDIGARYPAIAPILEALGNPNQKTLVVGAMLGITGGYLVKNSFLGFLAWRQMRFAFRVQANVSQRLFATYLRQPYTFHLQRNSAQMIRNVIGEVSLFTHKCLLPAMLLVTEALVMIGLVSLLLFIEPLGTVVAVSLLGFAAWTFHKSTRARIVRWGKERQDLEGLRIQHLQQGFGGAKDIRILGREDEFLAQFNTRNLRTARVAQYQATLSQLPRLWLELTAVMGLATLVLTMLAQGKELVSIMPTLGVFAAAAFRLLPSVNRVLGAVQSLRWGLPVINVLHEELKLEVPEPEITSDRDAAVFQQEARLVDVCYSYPGAVKPAVKGLSLTVKKGESVGIIGPSGSGKSTVVDLMLGLLTPDAGQMVVDGRDNQKDMRLWQDQIGYVPQSIYLTDDSLRRNVAFGVPENEIDDGAVRRAIEAAQLEQFVDGLSERYETFVGEHGIRLSGGQRQRIGIARALYHDPAILVLDEATSSLDTKTEREVMQAVTALQGNKTILIVAHRLSTVEKCDRLYRLDHGKVVEEGSPGEMLLSQSAAASR